MEENTRNYIELIDELRRQYKIKVEIFCSDICDARFYQRMLSGERNITHQRIFQFCEKLKISPSDFYYTASKRDRYELQRIYNLYQMIYTHDYSYFMQELSKINRKRLIFKQNERFLEYCITKSNFVHRTENDDKVVKKLLDLVDYPDCLKKDVFDFVDINILMLLAEIQIKYKNYQTLDKLIEILNNHHKIIARSDTNQMFPAIYSNTSLFLCRLNRFEDSLALSISGIKFSKEYNNLSSMSRLYYIKSHSLLKLGRKREAEIGAAKCIACAIAKGNLEEIRIFFKEIEFDHKTNPIDLIKRHQESINVKKAS